MIAVSPLDTWSTIDTALRHVHRDLSGGSSLPAFLNQHRNLYQGKSRRPKKIRESECLHVEVILAWGKAQPARAVGKTDGGGNDHRCAATICREFRASVGALGMALESAFT